MLEALEPRVLLNVSWPTAPFSGTGLYVNQNGDAAVTGHSINPTGDHDPWEIFFDNSGAVSFETTGSTDTEMAFYDGSGLPDITNDNDGVGANARISTSISSWTRYWLEVAGYNDTTTGSYGMDIDGPSAGYDTISISTDTNSGSAISNIGNAYDYVFHRFTTTASGSWTVTVDPTGSLDPTFNIYDSSGSPVAGGFTSTIDSHASGGAETWTGTLSWGSTYYVRVDGNDSSTGDFEVRADGPQPDDPYEENDTRGTAWDFSGGEGQWLSSYGGSMGIQADDDWYEIGIAPGYEHLVVDLTFTDADGDINLQVVDTSGTVRFSSTSTSDDEYIDEMLPWSGTWYLRVYHGDQGNTYDLRWDSILPGPPPGDGVTNHKAILIDGYGTNEDIYGMRDALLGSVGGEWIDSNITLIEYADATVANVQAGIQSFFGGCDEDDLALVYFTCHGAQTDADASPVDESDGLDGELAMSDGNISDDTLGSWLSPFGAGFYPLDRFVLIVDACHSGEVMDGSGDPAGILASHVIMSASQAWETAYGGNPYSEFTTHLIDALTSDCRPADVNDDGYVSAEEAFEWADPRSSDQDPEMSDTFSDELYLISYEYADDPYEENDTRGTAWDFSGGEGQWLSSYGGAMDIQADDDWYEINIMSGCEHLVVDLTFTDADGDINLQVVDTSGAVHFSSTSTSDDEHIDEVLPWSGTWYLRVYHGDQGNAYDLRWDSIPSGPPPGDGVISYQALLIDRYINEDIYGMRDALLSSAGGEWIDSNITLIEYADATVANVQAGIQSFFGGCDEDDLALIYFTCYGAQTDADAFPVDESDGTDGELVMSDGNISDDTLGSWLSPFGAGFYPLDRFVLIVDAAYSGEVMDGSGDPAGILASHVIMSASQAWETAYGGDPYSEFTTHLIDALTTDAPSADVNGDGYVSAEEAFEWADPRSSDQDPEMSDTFSGELYLISYEYSDDPYEENDTRGTAWDFSGGEGQWLSNYGGSMDIQADDDWFEINIMSGYEHLVVDLTFTDAYGDIDLQVVDTSGAVHFSSTSTSDDEHIDEVLPWSGTWYLRVYYGNQGNAYDLRWDSILSGPPPGDSDNDGDVDLDDLFAVRNNFGIPSGASRAQGDVAPHPGGDGAVDLDDLFMIRNNFGYGMSAAPDEPMAALSTAPPVEDAGKGVSTSLAASPPAVQGRAQSKVVVEERYPAAHAAEADVLAEYACAGAPNGFDPLGVAGEPTSASRLLTYAGTPIALAVTALPHESTPAVSADEATAPAARRPQALRLGEAAPQLGEELPDVLALPALQVPLATP